MVEADRGLWGDKNHRKAVFKGGLTPDFLVKQYNDGHAYEVGRMTQDLLSKGFTSRQATAYVADETLRKALDTSAGNFIACSVPIPKSKDKNVATSFANQGVELCYLEKVRDFNIPALSEYYSECIGFAKDFESYSRSPERVSDGCTIVQSERHEKTRKKAILGFHVALQEGFKRGLATGRISQTDLHDLVNDMVSKGNRTSQLPTKDLKDRIKKRGEKLHMTCLYKRDNVFTVTKPTRDQARKFYKECVEGASTGLKGTFTPSQQGSLERSEPESSDQDSRFLH